MKFTELHTKNDYINYCLDHYTDILDIDPAIPVEINRACKELPTPSSNLCTIYYEDGIPTYENIVAKATIAYQRKQVWISKDSY